jgi:putative tryptophan/tyrosine transport system substrate-binding protein
MTRLSRRRLVQGAGAVGLGLRAGCGRWPGQAPPASSIARIGVLTPIDPAAPNLEAFRQGLADYGYAEGPSLRIEWRDADGQVEQFVPMVDELVRLPVHVLVTEGKAATDTAKQTTTTLPIVMVRASDPVESGLVMSLARPGANVTGLADLSRQLIGKRLELLNLMVPGMARVAFLWNPDLPGRAHESADVAAAARALSVDLLVLELRAASDLPGALRAASQQGAEALLVQGNFLTTMLAARIVDLMSSNRLPTMLPGRSNVVQGGLMAYGPSTTALWRRAAYYVDRVLKGAKPADLPVEQPREFEFVINARTAQALGLTIPTTCCSRPPR